jgi:thymidylate synthase
MLDSLPILTIRQIFVEKFLRKEIVTNESGSLSGANTIEILGASFIANEPTIFGATNLDYVQHELDWYESMSLNVHDIPGGPPKIWEAVASKCGWINSNYGYLIFHRANGSQFEHAVRALVENPQTRRASMIYTRPTMHSDWNADGMSDFICTNCVQYLIRDGRLDVVVQMRSNDAWAGYRNDYAWQRYVQHRVIEEYIRRTGKPLAFGQIHWQVSSLHIYERQFYLLDHFSKTGEISITKAEYNKLYGQAN